MRSTAAVTSASTSRPGTGRTCNVTSLTRAERHWAELAATSSAAPAHKAARKVRIAITPTSARLPAESVGTSGALRFSPCEGGSRRASWASWARPGAGARLPTRMALLDTKLAVAQNEAARIHLVQEPEIVRRNHDRRAEPIEF